VGLDRSLSLHDGLGRNAFNLQQKSMRFDVKLNLVQRMFSPTLLPYINIHQFIYTAEWLEYQEDDP
jgi:hypothetical protein